MTFIVNPCCYINRSGQSANLYHSVIFMLTLEGDCESISDPGNRYIFGIGF